MLRAIDTGDSCVVEAEVYPAGADDKAMHPGPYTFADTRQATAFMTDAVEALMYLGCDVHAQVARYVRRGRRRRRLLFLLPGLALGSFLNVVAARVR